MNNGYNRRYYDSERSDCKHGVFTVVNNAMADSVVDVHCSRWSLNGRSEGPITYNRSFRQAANFFGVVAPQLLGGFLCLYL